mmetsp:Transcript_54702/g.102422  ORF Transcript_54702/g.102422 Transcript_54702/m.102422 type:complete len:196 (-) Transcript_54702:358-945(-)
MEILPPPPGMGGLVWADLDEETLATLDSVSNPQDKILILNDAMGVRHYQDNPKSTIMVDFCFYNIMFCDENSFSIPKKSAFFSVMKQVFEHAFEAEASSSSAEVLPVNREESLEYFKAKILAHSVNAPEIGRSAVFDLPEIKLMIAFVAKTFYRNFSAYRVCFTTRQPVESAIRYLAIETPMLPNPLDFADPFDG